jgi:hypothetical protein
LFAVHFFDAQIAEGGHHRREKQKNRKQRPQGDKSVLSGRRLFAPPASPPTERKLGGRQLRGSLRWGGCGALHLDGQFIGGLSSCRRDVPGKLTGGLKLFLNVKLISTI